MNRGILLAIGGLACTVAWPARLAWAETPPPLTRLTEVPIQSVTIDDPFWSPKLAVWRRVTIADCLDKFEHDGAMANFDHVARGELTAQHGGPPWYDGLIYEMIRAAADFIAERPDPALEARIDAMIDRISAAAARDPDGYINTYTQLKEPSHRWGQNGGNDLWQHDLYNAGALVDAGVHYYHATGKTKLLETAVRIANLMCRDMGPPPRHNVIPGHAIGEEALVGLYRLFEAQPDLKARLQVPVEPGKYLELAQFWIDARGHHEGRKDFGAYDQDARLHRTWQRGDVVTIHMAMPIEHVKADPRVQADRGRVALMRGPIVYCLESIDNGGRVRDLVLPDSARIGTEDRPDLLGGVTVLHASPGRVQTQNGSDAPADITAIPYYANANRGPVSMIVWIPTDAAASLP